MITDTKQRIINYIESNSQARVHDLVQELKLGNVAIHRQLNKLIQDGTLKKVGKAPTVFYILNTIIQTKSENIPAKFQEQIDSSYLYISPQGELIEGFPGFYQWVQKTHQEQKLLELADEYCKTLKTLKLKTNNQDWVDASEKMEVTFKNDLALDKLLYADIYSIPKFGKTKLGQLVLYAKQSQSRNLTERVIELIKPIIDNVIKKYKVDAIAFIPPTIPRNIQFVDQISKGLKLNIAEIKLAKVSGTVAVPQKTLTHLNERIANARDSIFLLNTSLPEYKRILLIDDAAGSGATFNEVAKKIKKITNNKTIIIGFSIVGSINGGFEVIREV